MEQEKGWNMEKGVESYLDISQMRLFAEGNWEYEQEPRMIREDGSIKEVWTGGSLFRWEHGQKEAAPRLVESCMTPGKCTFPRFMCFWMRIYWCWSGNGSRYACPKKKPKD